ncbi:Sfb3p ASCRUDRAFT_73987 [Ascoidea rubescens DSM 1968]|uniref:Beta-sandwich domain of Sec23/24 n=1 Tax=Ascoidea rubescens DSM 1968 TaxID=1344418 RepID=A0A1D2VRV8_9ASCO|nr:hypothetical protein ASCRUDRAFT_73987 [Ascoidea rubescens DSM 1968]ODV64343.1 hypothetical protein ASCRUDRAFT_73987 [Ascoidea rubescens DSM 1968]
MDLSASSNTLESKFKRLSINSGTLFLKPFFYNQKNLSHGLLPLSNNDDRGATLTPPMYSNSSAVKSFDYLQANSNNFSITAPVTRASSPAPQSYSSRTHHKVYNNPTPYYSQHIDQPQTLQVPQIQFNQGLRQVSSTIPDPGSLQDYIPDRSLSVPAFRSDSQLDYKYKSYLTFQNACPPPSEVHFKVVDQGIASPKYMRSSMYNLPSSERLRSATSLPVGVYLRPFCPAENDGDEPIPEIDLTFIGGPPRCRRCRCYINPSMIFVNDGNRFICNLCQFPNDCPSDYYSPLGPDRKRIDYFQRPELTRGIVDFILPKAYNLNPELPPNPIHHIFLIDVSYNSIHLGLNKIAAESIRSILYDDNYWQNLSCGSKIAIVTFDKSIHFYNLSPDLSEPEISIMADIDDPFLPIYNGFLVDPIESRSIIEETLDSIETIFDSINESYSCFGSALKVCQQALDSLVEGGKITCILSSMPSWGPGSLSIQKFMTEGKSSLLSNALSDHEAQKLIFKPDSAYYENLLKDFLKSNVGLDLFVVSNSTVDLANVALITSKTGGNLKYYQNFNPVKDERQFISDFKKSLTTTIGYQGQLKVRCSSGLQVRKYYGNSHKSFEFPYDPIVSTLSSDMTFNVLFEYDGKLDTKYDSHFQAAFLYTSTEGVRKVRVMNLCLAVTDRLVDVFSFLDMEVSLDIIIRDCLDHIPGDSLKSIRDTVLTKLVDVLGKYKGLVAKSSSLPGQLVLPDGLKLLPIYLLAFQKSSLWIKNTLTDNDSKVYQFFNLNNYPLDKLLYYLYPAIFPVHKLLSDFEGEVERDENGKELYDVPDTINCLKSSIEDGGCYLAFNGEKLMLWIQRNAVPLLIQHLFGEKYNLLNDLDPLSIDELPELETELNIKTRKLIKYLTSKANIDFLQINLIRDGIDIGKQREFFSYFVEDSGIDDLLSYTDFLGHIHRSIKVYLSGQVGTLKNPEVVDGGPFSFAKKFKIF